MGRRDVLGNDGGWILYSDLFASLSILFLVFGIGYIPIILSDKQNDSCGADLNYLNKDVLSLISNLQSDIQDVDEIFSKKINSEVHIWPRGAVFEVGKSVQPTTWRIKSTCSIIHSLSDTAHKENYNLYVKGRASGEYCSPDAGKLSFDGFSDIGVVRDLYERYVYSAKDISDIKRIPYEEKVLIKNYMYSMNFRISSERALHAQRICFEFLTSSGLSAVPFPYEVRPAYPSDEDILLCSSSQAIDRNSATRDERSLLFAAKPIGCR